MEYIEWPDLVMGIVLGFAFAIIIANLYIPSTDYYKQRIECEKVLPRNQKCVNIWVPETK